VLSESSFVIFQDTSRYNRTGNTYDARHNQMTTDEFRNYIGEIVSDISKCKEKNLKRKNHLILLKPSKFKSKRRLLTTEEVVLLNKIILLAKKRENEEKKLKEKYNIGAEVDFSKTVYFTSPRPHKDLFKKYLESLSRQQIILIAAVMYGGRDMIPPQWGTPLDVNIAELAENDHLIEKILEKEPLVRYLRKGLKLYIS
jgi:serine/threonine-protein kinase